MPIRKVKGGWKIENVDHIFPDRQQAVKALQAIKIKQREKRVGRKLKQQRQRGK